YERVRGAVGALEEATEAVREHGHDPRGVVRVTANPDITEMGVAESIATLHAKHPSIHIELVLTTRVVDLVAESIDLAIRAGRLADSTLIAKSVGSTDMGLYATKPYLKKHGAPKKLAELSDHECILFRGHRGRSTWELEGPRGPQRIDI